MTKEASPNKVVCVTGAARRIGAAIVRKFHQQGFDVIIHYNNSLQEALQLTEELNRLRSNSAKSLSADLCNQQQLNELGKKIVSQFDRLDVLVNNASSFYPTKIGQSSQQDWDKLMDSNLRGAFFLSQSLASELKTRQGAIINIIDSHANKPLAGHALYSIAKGGLKTMTRALALELAPEVRVNAVSPGAILWPESLQNGDDPQVLETRKNILSKIPAGRLGEVSDIADTVYFLAESASYITGHTIKVDGGRFLGK